MLITTSGDLLTLAENGRFDVIIHGCNCMNTFGSGLARTIRERYPAAYDSDKKTMCGDRNKLGTYSVMRGEHFSIINAYTQYGFNTRGSVQDVFEYDAFQRVLDRLVDDWPGHHFGLPMIGMGLAAGDPTRIIPMIERFACDIDETGGTVTLVKFSV